MAIVKGSKQYRMVVVPYRPWLPVVSLFSMLVIMLFTGAALYKLGLMNGSGAQKQAMQERDRLLIDVARLGNEASELQQQVARLSLGAEVDRQASEDVRAEVIELKSQIAELEEDISFYRGLMSPSEAGKGLTIGAVNIVVTGNVRVYDYQVMIQQLAERHERLNGYLTFHVIGRQQGLPVTLSLKDIDSAIDDEKIKLRFKYFQSVKGQLRLPEDFEPERIELKASSTGQNAAVVEKTFGWLVQEH